MSTDTSTVSEAALSTRAKAHLRNRDILTSHGNIALRKAAVDIIEHALQAANPYPAVRRLVQLDGHLLSVGDLVFDLKRYERIFVMGTGKASLPIAQALEDILGDRISDGLFVLKHGTRADLNRTKVIYAAHPVPDENGHKGAQAMMEMAEGLAKNDLVFAGISGGSPALLPLPVKGVSLADKKKVNQVLLHCGADIIEINAVRKHLSRIKGGWLAKAILPATLVNLTVSDVVGDPLDYITGPTVPDTSTFDDARGVLDRYDLDISIRLLAEVDEDKCTGCDICVRACASGVHQAIEMVGDVASANREKCDGCGLCVGLCPVDAITLESR